MVVCPSATAAPPTCARFSANVPVPALAVTVGVPEMVAVTAPLTGCVTAEPSTLRPFAVAVSAVRLPLTCAPICSTSVGAGVPIWPTNALPAMWTAWVVIGDSTTRTVTEPEVHCVARKRTWE